MGILNKRKALRLKRKKRIRKKLIGTTDRPRMSVYRSAKYRVSHSSEYTLGVTLASASTMEKEVREQQNVDEKMAPIYFLDNLVHPA